MKTEEEIEKVYYTQTEVRQMYGIQNQRSLINIIKRYQLPCVYFTQKIIRFRKEHLGVLEDAVRKERIIKDIKIDSNAKIDETMAAAEREFDALEKHYCKEVKNIKKRSIVKIQQLLKAVRKVNNDPPV